MKIPEYPENEASRLKTLRSLDVLDTAAEERFDRITRISKRLFDVPVVLVSLVDENRQWFKSCVGVTVRETPRDISFCGHAILGADILFIPDTLGDERFADNPLVIGEPFIRFYAGCPLKAKDGSKLGTLCLIDTKPRSMTQDELDTLRDLSAMVERELEAVQLATLDELTGVSNRRGFMPIARHSLQLCIRSGTRISLAFIDLNDFKPINDNFGHAEGDHALIEFTKQVGGFFRETDLFARLGGDEFVIMFSDTSGDAAQSLMEKFTKVLADYNQRAARGYELSFSYGVVEFDPDQHESLEALVKEGDELMFEHKRNRR